MNYSSIPVIGFAGYSGAGKTTLLVQLISLFKSRNINIGVIKHTHHCFEIDYPGKDSYELRKAGANQVLISSRKRWALISENESQPVLANDMQKLDICTLDIIFVEGCKAEPIPKIEIYRPSMGYPLLSNHDHTSIAIATDDKSLVNSRLPLFELDDPAKIVDFLIEKYLRPAS